MQTKERDKSKKRAAIMDGAAQVFIDDGFDLASMDKIAEVAGVSKRTVYNHFESKELLFEAIVQDILDSRSDYKKISYDASKPLKDQLKEFAELEIYFIDTPRKLELSRFLSITFLRNRELQKKLTAKNPPISFMLMNWFEAARNDGKIKTDDVITTVRIFYGMVVGTITWPVLFTEGLDRSAVSPLLDEVIDVFLAKYAVID